MRRESIKTKFFTLIVVVLITYVFLYYVFIQYGLKGKRSVNQVVLKLDNVIVHLDLKGAPPRLKYLETLLPVLKDNGVTGILMEYEDMYPYEGKLFNLSAKNCYKKGELKTFLSKAVATGLEIIPLIQTFGHMEHVLKLQEFQHLRENPKVPDSICPSNRESGDVIKEMLRQVIEYHISVAPLRHVHIGCDEVFHLNECYKCSMRNLEKKDIFLNHVNKVTDIVHQLSPNTTVLMWDDMFRQIKVPQWSNLQVPHNIEPVYWDYLPELAVSHVHLMYYHRHFDNIWIASAFKGADGITATLPNFKKRFDNHVRWLSFVNGYMFGGETTAYTFKGIILTGWSRYSHMDPLCELLPASLPTLMFNLMLIKAVKNGVSIGNFEPYFHEIFSSHVNEELRRELNCITEGDEEDLETDLACAFNGIDLYNALKEFLSIKIHVEEAFSSEYEAYSCIEFYSKLNKINMNNAIKSLQWTKNIFKDVLDLEGRLNNILYQYYEVDVIEEYLSYKLSPIKAKLTHLQKILTAYTIPRSWERGPVHINGSVHVRFV